MATLASELKLPCGAVLSNRLAKAAMTEGLGDANLCATDKHVSLYRRWSEGGAGLLLTGNVLVDKYHLERAGNIAIDGNNGLDQLRAMASAGTVAGNHLWMQINHPGRQTPASINPEPLAPSAVGLDPAIGCGNPRAMTEAQIKDVIARFVQVARVAQDTGFTGVQIHAAHGYLMSQFLSPLSNRRTDAWGGSLENRARALLEIVRQTRAVVGRSFPISVKLNSADFQKGGFSDTDSTQVVQWLGEAGIDLLEISGGNYEAQHMVGRSVEQLDSSKAQSTLLREAYFLEYAKQLRPVANMPLMVTGGFRSKLAMSAALENQELDVIGIARPLCPEPDICQHLLSGEKSLAPSPEQVLKLDRTQDYAQLSESEFRSLETTAQVAWSSMQIVLMGNGQDPEPTMTLGEALERYASYDESLRNELAMQR